MDRIGNRFTLLCVLIFGLCEARWEIEDDWIKNPPSVPRSAIENRANIRLSEVEGRKGEQIQFFQRILQEYEEDIANEKKTVDDLQKKIAETEDLVYRILFNEEQTLKLELELFLLQGRLNISRVTIAHKMMALPKLNSTLRQLIDLKNNRIADIEYRKQQSLSDSEQGVNTKSRVRIVTPTVSISLNVPRGCITLYVENKEEDEGIGLTISNVRSIFEYHKNFSGPPLGYGFWNDTYQSYKLYRGNKMNYYDEDCAFERVRHMIMLSDSRTVKQVKYLNPDGTTDKLHETIEELRGDVFKQSNKIWKYENMAPDGKWSVLNSTDYSIDLNDLKGNVILKKPCQSSLTIRKSEGIHMIRATELICENDIPNQPVLH